MARESGTGIPEPSLQELDIKVSHDRELRVKQVDLMGRLSNPGKDFVQVSDKGVRDREGRRDVDAEAAKWRASCDRRTQIRLGPADIERLIAAYAEGNTVLQLAARFNPPHYGAHSSRAQRCPSTPIGSEAQRRGRPRSDRALP